MSRLSVVILLAKIGKKKSLPSQQREDKQAHAVGAWEMRGVCRAQRGVRSGECAGLWMCP